MCASPPSRLAGSGGIPGIGGIQWAKRLGKATACAGGQPAGGSANGTPPSPSFSGTPPLIFNGGAVVGTATPGELTVTPVYWVPTGGGYSIPAPYEALVNRFITDVAADSGKTTNVFSVLQQYTNANGANLTYALHAGTPITDTNRFPTNGCTPDSGTIYADSKTYTKCITNAQLLSEASAVVTAKHLPDDLAHLYMFFLPEGVETCFTGTNGAGGGQCSINASANPSFCGYHAYGAPPLVADMNFANVDSPTGYTCSSAGGSNTGGNQSPNGNIAADSEISITSHEISETITDPEGTAWLDSSGNEIGDDCAYVFGNSASWHGSPGALYDQTINGHHYFIQEEFSNHDFGLNPANACSQGTAWRSLDHIVVSPGSASIRAGGSRPFTAAGYDVTNHALGDHTAATTFTISPDGAGTGASCTANRCTATEAGVYTVTGHDATKSATASLTVTKGSQSIRFGPLRDKLYGVAPFAVSAAATSQLTVSLASLTRSICRVSSSHVTVLAAGLCDLRATQAGNGNWTAAAPVDASFLVTYNVSKLSPTARTKLKRGSTFRVAFQLTGANGRLLPRSVAARIACPAATLTFNGPPRVCLAYDATTNYFQANIKTSSHLTVGAIYGIAITVVVVSGKIRRTVASARTSVRIIS